MKIADKMREAAASGKPFFSFEFFPPRTDEVQACCFVNDVLR
jgi:5,10-methylenetetrahydrofolate reductase